ncbi:Retrotransposon Copia-like, N-terminal [Dillenia turbinata]|uniref:Retrotransposon Copia-like, N-terminal n=1 Tax=Dillenia turbinata TaxID=194707 RepID=A0AAN8V9T5_9MAGN
MNYPTWRRAVTNALVSKHKIVFVDGRLPKPAEGDLDEENWITCNSMVMSWILNSLNEELHDSIVYHDTARDSGTSDYIVSDATLLKATSILTRLITVTLPDGEKAETTIVVDVDLNDHICLKRDLVRKTEIGSGRLKGGLYQLYKEPPKRVYAAESSVETDLLHRRLGHFLMEVDVEHARKVETPIPQQHRLSADNSDLLDDA